MFNFLRALQLILALCAILSFSLQADPLKPVAVSVRLALAQSDSLYSKKLELAIQDQKTIEVKSAYFPVITMGAGIGREDSNNASTRQLTGRGSSEYERRESSVNVRQQLFDGYQTIWSEEASNQQESVLLSELAELEQNIAFDAYQAHISVETARRIEMLNKQNWLAHSAIADSIEKRVSLGRDDEADVSQVMARLALAAANLEQASGDSFVALSKYEALVGQPFEAEDINWSILEMDENDVNAYEAVVLEQNAGLRAAMQDIQRARYSARSSKSSRWPTLSIDAGATWNANIDGVRGRNSDAFAMLRLDYELYSGGKNRAGEKRKYIEVEQRTADFDDLRVSVRSQARAAWISLAQSKKRLKHLSAYVEAAKNTRLAYEKQFEIGRRSLVDLLDSENELAIARRELTLARQSHFRDYGTYLKMKSELLARLGLVESSE